MKNIIKIATLLLISISLLSCATQKSAEIKSDDITVYTSYLSNPNTKVVPIGVVSMYSKDPKLAKYFSKPVTARSMLLEYAKELYNNEEINYVINVSISQVFANNGFSIEQSGVIIEGLAVKLSNNNENNN